MPDVGDIEPESLFLSVIHFESLGVWRFGSQAEYHAPGKGVARIQWLSLSDGHAGHNPTVDSRHNTFTVHEGDRRPFPDTLLASLYSSPGDQAAGLEMYRTVPTGSNIVTYLWS